MKFSLTTLFCIVLFFLTSSMYAQVEHVSYMMKYDTASCKFDCYIVIDAGSANTIPNRAQLSTQYTIVVPNGLSLTITDKYMPLINNYTYTGTVPANWVVSNSYVSQYFTYYGIIPPSSPLPMYNDLAAGDTVKIFSVAIAGMNNCASEVHVYENGVDEDFNQTGGSDYSNGIHLGNVQGQYNGNYLSTKPAAPSITTLNVENVGNIAIDIGLNSPVCQSSMNCAWIGPNGYTSNDENLLIENATSSDFGTYNLIVTDTIGCQDSVLYLIEESAPVVDEVMLSDIVLSTSFEHIGVHCNILNDDNLNSVFNIEYRLVGTTQYLPSAHTMRSHPQMIVDGALLDMNFHAGSIMFLQPKSKYDIKITLSDVDGGMYVIDTTLITHAFATINPDANIIYVSPGNGGGDGSAQNPYLGIQDAVDNVIAGQVVSISDGIYTPFTLTTNGQLDNPIVIRSENLHGAIIDGGNTTTGILTLGSYNDSLQYVIIDGFEIKNGKWAIDAQNTQNLTIRNNKISDVDYGFVNRRENGWEHNQTISNNLFEGRTTWPQLNGEIPSERGIDIRGNEIVISHNSISNFGDGISMDGQPYKKAYSVDIHHNDITRIVDDLIEIDGVVSNARVYRNRCYNGRSGVSLAPIFGGPAYVFRNEFYNLEQSTFKMNRSPAGLYIVHNTSVNVGDGVSSTVGWQNTVFKNNVVVSGNYCIQEYGLVANSNDDWNNNAYMSNRAGTSTEPWFKWDAIKYDNVSDLQSGTSIESSGQSVALSDFENVFIPTTYDTEVIANVPDVSPTLGSMLIDNGAILNDINTVFVDNGTPDIGALEFGTALPYYGHDFGNVCSRNDLSQMIWNGGKSQAWYHPDNWIPCGVPNRTSATTIQAGVEFFPLLNTDTQVKGLIVAENGTLILDKQTELRVVGTN
ncbi:MAG: hypothetical protein V3V14_12195 [Saprospiraceae bacterium]